MCIRDRLWSIIGISFGLLVLLVNVTKTGLIPEEDTGMVTVSYTHLDVYKRQPHRAMWAMVTSYRRESVSRKH